ncbi:MAG TPA: VWA domain-containing protein [Thermoanaerobaculia bacterium]|nr:VWA domain-containing protein [Thermoanaerobaculia bacterium]
MSPRIARLAAAVAVSVLFFGPGPSPAADTSALAPQYRQFLEDVLLLITKAEKKAFLALEKDYQRDAFIQGFWKARDPYPETPRNEFEIEWRRRLEEVKEQFAGKFDDRGRIYQLHGEPAARRQIDCALGIHPLEIWRYRTDKNGIGTASFIFVRSDAPGAYTIWRPSDGFQIILPNFQDQQDPYNYGRFRSQIYAVCGNADGGDIVQAIEEVKLEERIGVLESAQARPEQRGDNEWIASFKAVSTDVDPTAKPLPARIATVEFLGGRENHTRLRALLVVPAAGATATEIAGHRSFEFMVTGEILAAGALHDSFRFRFDLPADAPGADLPLLVERELRPGTYTLVLKVEELATHKAVREVREIEVPPVATEAVAALAAAGSPAAPNASAASDKPAIRLVPPAGDLHTSTVRFETETDPRVRKVTFSLGDKALLTKARPPFSVELNLGQLPAGQTVKAVAFDEHGEFLGSDELTLNQGAQRFAVRLLSPRPGPARGRTSAEAEIKVPDGETLERLELLIDDRLVATLYQAPWLQPLDLPAGDAIVSVRAVAYLADGRSAEDLVVLNAPGEVGRLDVRLVELPVEVLDSAGKTVANLGADDFSVVEDGTAQQLTRCERIEKLPIRAALLLDNSASMDQALGEVQQAAAGFLRDALKTGDRAALLHFREKPAVDVPFTDDLERLTAGLAGLKAEGGTALFDSLVYTLDYMKGLSGPRALLLLTDGGDRSSRFNFDQALEAARRSGVVVYAIGLALPRGDLSAHHQLEKLAEATGGMALFPRGATELSTLYAAIDRDLRARYLLAYQSTNASNDGKFRTVEVKLKHAGYEVRAPAGYAP